MKAAAEGWCNRRPLKMPTHCRWCGLRTKVIRPNKCAVVICPRCDSPRGVIGGRGIARA